MPEITEADRQAAKELRVILADVSGFWFAFDDESPLCAALARHRIEAERRAAESRQPSAWGPELPRVAAVKRLGADKRKAAATLAA